jgi:hypothetical protein
MVPLSHQRGDVKRVACQEKQHDPSRRDCARSGVARERCEPTARDEQEKEQRDQEVTWKQVRWRERRHQQDGTDDRSNKEKPVV